MKKPFPTFWGWKSGVTSGHSEMYNFFFFLIFRKFRGGHKLFVSGHRHVWHCCRAFIVAVIVPYYVFRPIPRKGQECRDRRKHSGCALPAVHGKLWLARSKVVTRSSTIMRTGLRPKYKTEFLHVEPSWWPSSTWLPRFIALRVASRQSRQGGKGGI